MRAVACVDDYRVSNICSVSSSTFDGVTHYDCIASHGLYGQDSVAQAFAFNNTRRSSSDIYNVSAQIFTSQLERSTGTGTGFIEQVDDGFTTQGRNFFNVPFHNFFHFLSSFNYELNLFYAEAFQVEYISAAERYICFCH